MLLLALLVFLSKFLQARSELSQKVFSDNNVTNELLGKIKVIKSNPDYRVNDVLKELGLRWRNSTENILTNSAYNGTILKDYFSSPKYKKNCSHRERVIIVNEIIHQRIKQQRYKLPQQNELVIHIRAGDVVHSKSFLKRDYISLINSIILTKNGTNGNANSVTDIKFITFVLAFAFQEFKERKWWLYSDEDLEENYKKVGVLFSRIIQAFPQFTYNVYSNEIVDNDMIYCSQAKYFISDDSGFSRLLHELQRLNNHVHV